MFRNPGWIARSFGLPCSVTRKPSASALRVAGGSGCGDALPATSMLRNSWKFGCPLGVGVHDDAVLAGARQDDLLAQRAVGRDRRVPVDHRAQVVADEDQVHAGVRPAAALVARERLAVGLLDRERDGRRLAGLDRGRRLEVRELERPRRLAPSGPAGEDDDPPHPARTQHVASSSRLFLIASVPSTAPARRGRPPTRRRRARRPWRAA